MLNKKKKSDIIIAMDYAWVYCTNLSNKKRSLDKIAFVANCQNHAHWSWVYKHLLYFNIF